MVGVIAVSGDVFRGTPARKSRDYRQETVSTETTAAEQFTEETDPSAFPEKPVMTTEIQQGTAETTTNNMPERRTEAAQSGTHTTAAGSGSNTTPGQRRTAPHTTAASLRKTTAAARQTTVPPVRTPLRQTTTVRRTDLPQEQTTAAVTDWRPQTWQPTTGAHFTMITLRYDPDCKYSFV